MTTLQLINSYQIGQGVAGTAIHLLAEPSDPLVRARTRRVDRDARHLEKKFAKVETAAKVKTMKVALMTSQTSTRPLQGLFCRKLSFPNLLSVKHL